MIYLSTKEDDKKLKSISFKQIKDEKEEVKVENAQMNDSIQGEQSYFK